jgi:hypothetical protein
MDHLQRAFGELPYALREQVYGYARSVGESSREIAIDANIEWSPELHDRLVFFAGVRKLYGICASSFWAVDNAGAFMRRNDVNTVRVGGTNYSRGAEIHTGLRRMLSDFDGLLRDYDLTMLTDFSYVELARRVTNGS